MTTRTTSTTTTRPTPVGPSRLRRATAVVAGTVLGLSGLALATAPGALAAPKLTLSDSTVTAGQTVTVKGSGFPSKPTSLYITICANPPGATNCDVNLAHVTQLQYDGGGTFSTKYKVAVTKFASADGTIDCAKTQCVIGSTNALDPKDHAYNAVALFTVGGGATPSKTPKPKPTKTATPKPTATSGTSSPSTAAPAGTTATTEAGTLPKTGGDPAAAAPLLVGAGVAGVLAGLVLVLLAGGRRRGRHAG